MGNKRKLNAWETRELKRLEELKDCYIYEMMGKCEHLNEEIKRVKSGSWWEQHQVMCKQIQQEVNDGKEILL